VSRQKRQLGLSVFVQLYGTHGDAWRRPGVQAAGNPDLADWASLVQLMERGKFDFAFFADFVGRRGVDIGNGKQPRGRNFEPLTLAAALATVTTHIGLVATVNTNYDEPYNLARRLASLDHLSGGRIGWNIVSSMTETAAASFGVDSPLTPDQRYERGSEFVELSKQLWDSWDDGAFDYPDPEAGVAYDPGSAHPVHHRGPYYASDALLDIARPIQGYPVFFQAGNSETGREFAARHAEVIYAAAQTIEEAQAFYKDVKGRLAKYGREPDDLKVTPGLFYFLGKTRQEAQDKYQSFLDAVDLSGKTRVLMGVDVSDYPLDEPLPDNIPEPLNGRGRWRQVVALGKRENLTIRELILRFSTVQGHRIIIGTATDIADQIEEWFLKEAADGFNMKPATVPDSLAEFIDQVVPQLQRRGIFRADYEHKTLRDNLGLSRPPNRHSLRRAAE
jgi:FMN-dependent oxidoreductase (nitrilotriacetate monooxygenase family)